MSRIKLKNLNNKIGAKYIHNLPRVLHVITTLINLRQTLPVGRGNDIDKEYIFARCGLYSEDMEMFEQILSWLTEAEFYRQTTNDTYYVL